MKEQAESIIKNVGYYVYMVVNMYLNEVQRMRISYNKLWKLLIDKKMSKADLRKAVEMSPNTMTKMRRDEEVSMSVLLKIANYLKCDISDMVEFVDTEEQEA